MASYRDNLDRVTADCAQVLVPPVLLSCPLLKAKATPSASRRCNAGLTFSGHRKES